MSRYEEFKEEEDESSTSILNEEEQEEGGALVCVKELLSNPNPLMSKIEFRPYEAKNHYPVPLSRLPPILNHHEYHLDRNNMIMLDESLFSHEKMKKDLARLYGAKQTVHQQ